MADAKKWIQRSHSDVRFIPDLESCCRILHPASNGPGESQTLTWTDIAHELRLSVYPEISWDDFELSTAGREEGNLPWYQEPPFGQLQPVVRKILISAITDFFGGDLAALCDAFTWTGYANINPADFLPHQTEIANREYFVTSGSLTLYSDRDFASNAGPAQWTGPNICWPADQSWCISSAIDDRSTFVAGSRELVFTLLRTTGLECFEISDDSVAAYRRLGRTA